jgi:AbrB family looped-hinge helix DNA binding protein
LTTDFYRITFFTKYVIQGEVEMDVVTSTVKGQIVIPADLRKKFKINKGTCVRVYDDGKRIIVEPINEDPVLSGKGMLKTRGKALKALIADREKESKL